MPAELGYIGIGQESGTFVPLSKAYEYALERCLIGTDEDTKDFKEMLVEWFYSGNWIKAE